MSMENSAIDKVTAPPAKRRIAAVDVLRGVALIAMAIYHFSWDLEYFGYIEPGTVASGGWKLFARLIAGSFLFLAGFSLVLGNFPEIRSRGYLIRLAKIVAAAAVITIATWFAFPDAFIFFGILHAIAAASVVGLVFLRLPPLLTLVAAAAIFAAPFYLRSPVFDTPALWWVGLSEMPMRSNDYVPLLPWLAPFLAGLAAARIALATGFTNRLASFELNGKVGRWLGFGGRHSLAVYLIHQPLLIALVYLFSLGFPGTKPFERSCVAACIASQPQALCTAFCSCTADKLVSERLFSAFNAGELTNADPRIVTITEQCTMEAQPKE
ncbi:MULTISPECIES: DUF1624 domain-containing protein [unclassified Rhizobium]|uniref:heparan-alpha-glucosaminide N-acetyltransferase n=2 Tax=unclassified Rhizobium TaxID=2613769 RepID=UPI0006F5438B|nr:hypothetical protein ASC86_19635 [Rhizobium sp. Root1212]KRD21425.1 hypothetical protein ASE37_17960 [Rhizobium sp. Root268]